MTRMLKIGVLLCASALLLVCMFFTTAHAQGNTKSLDAKGQTTSRNAQQSPTRMPPVRPVNTSSPRATLQTFLRLSREIKDAIGAYQKTQDHRIYKRLGQLGSQFVELLDLKSVPAAARRRIGRDAAAYLLDTIGRLPVPSMDAVPDANAIANEKKPARWRFPNTTITIERIEEGPREGEFLFSARTVARAKTVFERNEHLPLRTSPGFESWRLKLRELHGPMVPVGLVAALPISLKQLWLDTPIWKILTVVILVLFAISLLYVLHRAARPRAPERNALDDLRRILTPAAIILVVLTLKAVLAYQIPLSGIFAQAVSFTVTVVTFAATAWAFWLGALAFFEWIIRSPKIPDESFDANLLRLGARVIGSLGGALVIGYGVHVLGVPVLGLVAGLGVGGLAIALAIRPTLENLISGVTLYIDRPVRIGDFCNVGTLSGTVERIGLRSTQIRALDRTLVSMPNAAFADMEIINWAECDRMLILEKINLRYETDNDQLRYVLAKLREMFIAHPKIDTETVRVRFIGYGASSLDIEIRVYALVRDFNNFFAIQEDVFLRVNQIVRESGTDFAFPSQTLYLNRDGGLDEESSAAADQQVQAWRSQGRLPFPFTPADRREQLIDTLDYPPRGSPDASQSAADAKEEAELLSAEPQQKEPESGGQPANS